MRHFASRAFWEAYQRLPDPVRMRADKNYALLKENPRHPSLQFKRVGRFWSVRVTALSPSKLTAIWCGSGSVRTRTMTPCSVEERAA
jgi:hypothetical protein